LLQRLTGDVKWPASTTFSDALGMHQRTVLMDEALKSSVLGPLCGSFPILSLRTNKADVAVGISGAAAERLDREGIAWRVNGK
jgi:damage-control phosphatase, subfamily III